MTLTCRNPLSSPPEVERILVIRLGALGDVARTVPAVLALRDHYRDARLCWLVEPSSQALPAAVPAVDRVLVFPRDELSEALRRGRLDVAVRRAAAHLRELRRERFDLVLDFHGILKSGVLAGLSGARLRVGYGAPFARENASRFYHHQARFSGQRTSRFERNAGLVRFLGVPVPATASPVLTPDPEDAKRARSWLDAEGAAVVVHPGSSPDTPYKRYTVSGYAEAVRGIAEKAGVRSLVTWGPSPGEEAFAIRVAAASGGTAAVASAPLALPELIATLAEARVVIASDTGPLHIASLAGTPVVQLLGPTDPVENEPWGGTPWRRLRVPFPCSPCRRGCDAAPCMPAIAPARVAEAAVALLSAAG